MTSFYMERNTGLKWIKYNYELTRQNYEHEDKKTKLNLTIKNIC